MTARMVLTFTPAGIEGWFEECLEWRRTRCNSHRTTSTRSSLAISPQRRDTAWSSSDGSSTWLAGGTLEVIHWPCRALGSGSAAGGVVHEQAHQRDLNCADIPYRNFRVLWNVPDPDPHHFDGNHNGIGCET